MNTMPSKQNWRETRWVLEPIVDLADDKVRAYELLTRPCPRYQHHWRELYHMVPYFIESLREAEEIDPAATISVNVDTLHILDRRIMQDLTSLAGMNVAIEWTEYRQAISGSGDDRIAEVARSLKHFRDGNNIAIWIDDAGTGEDALGRIGATNPDLVKISGKLFRKSLIEQTSQSMVNLLVNTLQTMEILTVIEWVEKDGERVIAERYGANWAQGYLWPGFTAGTPEDVAITL